MSTKFDKHQFLRFIEFVDLIGVGMLLFEAYGVNQHVYRARLLLCSK